jgi:predicted membrane protein
MRNQGRILVGAGLIVAGLVFLVGSLLGVDPGILCFPTFLILLGFALLLRPWLVDPDSAIQAAIFGPINRSGAWQVAEEEIWLLVGDVNLDLADAEIPPGETVLRVFGLVGSVRLFVPEGVGVRVSPTSLLADVRLFDRKWDVFVGTRQPSSDDYETAEYRIRLAPTFLVADVRVRRA